MATLHPVSVLLIDYLERPLVVFSACTEKHWAEWKYLECTWCDHLELYF